jgi:hypothetical protein
MKEFSEALNKVEFEYKETVYLEKLLKLYKKTLITRLKHDINTIKSIIKRIITRLNEPNLLGNLIYRYSKSRFYIFLASKNS